MGSETIMRAMPVVAVMKVMPVPEVVAMAAKVTVAEMATATMEAAMTTMTVPDVNDAVVRCCSAKFRRRQRLRGGLRRGQHHKARHGEKA